MPQLTDSLVPFAVGTALLVFGFCVCGCTVPTVPPLQVASTDPGAAARGEYLVTAGNCIGCHTDEKHGGTRFAGGKPIETPFGTYYSGNITPDPTTGIGAWSDIDFLRAVRQGVKPSGSYYFPAFPFPSFTLMNDRDIIDIKAYLSTQPPIVAANRSPEVPFPFNFRAVMAPWRMLYFTPGPYVPDPVQSAEWNRGAYLANAVSHCGECHTPRGPLGAVDLDHRFAGTMSASSGIHAPNITSDRGDGIGNWTVDEIAQLLKIGMTPRGDFVGGAMAEVIRGTSKLETSKNLAVLGGS